MNDRMINRDQVHPKFPGKQGDNLCLSKEPVGMHVGNLILILQPVDGQASRFKLQAGEPPGEGLKLDFASGLDPHC